MKNSLQSKVIDRSRKLLSQLNCNTRHFSFIIKRNKIISEGFNSNKTHTFATRFNHKFQAIHSELSAIKNFPYPLSKLKYYKIVNVRLTKKGKGVFLSRPCASCYNLLKFFDIKEIWYSTNSANFSKMEI